MTIEEKKQKWASDIKDTSFKNAEALQAQCHKATEQMMKDNPNLSVQDCTNVFLYQKLGELQAVNTFLIEQLKSQQEWVIQQINPNLDIEMKVSDLLKQFKK